MNIFSKLLKQKTEEKAHSQMIDGTVLESIGFSFQGLQTDNKLINEGYVSNTDVYAIVKKICEVSSCVPFIVEEWDGEEWILNEDSQLNELLKKPNENINGKDFRFISMLYLLNTGDLFWRKLISRFDLVTELSILESNIIQLDLDSNYNVKRYIYENFSGLQTELATEEVDHLLFYNPSYNGLKNKRGLSPLQAAYNSLTSANNRLEAMSHAYENRGATNIISSGSDIVLAPKERDKLQKNTDKIIGGAKNFNKSIVTTANVRVTPLGMSPTDLKLIEAKELDLRDICNAFGVPSTLFNDQAASTLDNLKVGTKMMYNNAIIPNNEKLISKLNESIVPAYAAFENKELRISQDLSGVDELQEDQLVKAQKSQTEVSTILSISNDSSLKENQKESMITNLGYEYVPPLDEQEDGTGTGNSEVQLQSLNGAQVTSMVTIVQSVSEGMMPKLSAIGILMASYGMTEEEAGKIINPI